MLVSQKVEMWLNKRCWWYVTSDLRALREILEGSGALCRVSLLRGEETLFRVEGN